MTCPILTGVPAVLPRSCNEGNLIPAHPFTLSFPSLVPSALGCPFGLRGGLGASTSLCKSPWSSVPPCTKLYISVQVSMVLCTPMYIVVHLCASLNGPVYSCIHSCPSLCRSPWPSILHVQSCTSLCNSLQASQSLHKSQWASIPHGHSCTSLHKSQWPCILPYT